MPRSRDRHGRGFRGPLVAPSPWSKHLGGTWAAPKADFFAACVNAAVDEVRHRCPEALVGINVLIDDVPRVTRHTAAVPLASSSERPGEFAHVVLFRRPLERRAASRGELRQLVQRMFVEQLIVLTGKTARELVGRDLDDDW